MVILDHDEIRALADCMDPRHRALLYVLAYTGLRVGEVLALTPEDVNLARREITVSKTLTMQSDYSLSVGEPKTANGYRTAPLPRSVADLLSDHMETYPSEHLFTGGRGARMQPNNFNNRDFPEPSSNGTSSAPRQGYRRSTLASTICGTQPSRTGSDSTQGSPECRHGQDTPQQPSRCSSTRPTFPNDDSTFMDALDQGMAGD